MGLAGFVSKCYNYNEAREKVACELFRTNYNYILI